eukprot:1177006-Prorocentrum_minimum.AAC.4
MGVSGDARRRRHSVHERAHVAVAGVRAPGGRGGVRQGGGTALVEGRDDNWRQHGRRRRRLPAASAQHAGSLPVSGDVRRASALVVTKGELSGSTWECCSHSIYSVEPRAS